MSKKPVLCAVDVSEGDVDSKVLSKAAQLADLDGAGLDVVTVLPDYGMSLVGSFFDKGQHSRVEDEARKRLDQMIEDALGAERNANVRHVVLTGKAYEAILRTAEKAGTGLIVMGAHKPELSDYLLGPNAARVVRHAKCSVYVVR